MSITIENQTNFKLPQKIIEEITQSLTDKEIDLIICNDNTMRDLNDEYRGINRATDVLSFPLVSELPMMPLGAIVISSDYAKLKAKEFGHTAQEESILLFVHGLLHILGYDHEVDSGEMRAQEEEIIKRYNLPSSLIVRANQKSSNQ